MCADACAGVDAGAGGILSSDMVAALEMPHDLHFVKPKSVCSALV